MRAFAALLLLGALIPISAPSPARAEASKEYQVKAVFLFNFLRFAAWPEGKPVAEGYTLCTLGGDPFGGALEYISRKKSAEIKSRVRHLDLLGGETASCHLIFARGGAAAELRASQARMEALHILTVSDAPGFTKKGGMIEFFEQSGKLRFRINPESVAGAGIKLSAKLLELAEIEGGAP